MKKQSGRVLNTVHKSMAMAAVLLGGTVGSTLVSRPALADAHSYSSEPRQVKACVLVSSAALGVGNVPENVTPHIFHIMDERTDMKPSGWQFVNPLASATITGDIYARWSARAPSDPAFNFSNPISQAFRVGAPLTKNLGAYWEVNLDTVAAADLQQFDVVLMAYHYPSTQFSPSEREKLLRYVDGGGTVWLEDEGGFDIESGGGQHNEGQFIVDLGFTAGLGGIPALATTHHPLVSFPFPIDATTIGALGASQLGTHHVHQGVNAVGTVGGYANPRVLVPVVWSGGGSGLPAVSAGDFGAGHIVVSSLGIATGVNSFVGGVDDGEGGNSGVVSGETTLAARPTDLKFAYNILAWTSSVPTSGVNARRTASTNENVGAVLGTRWNSLPLGSVPSLGSGVAMFKSVAFYVDGTNVLHAFDISPGEDLDNDGNPDDGIPDFIFGAPYDEIWNVNLNGLGGTTASSRVSTPTVVSVFNPSTGQPEDIVCVTNSVGGTMAFLAFPPGGAPFPANGVPTVAWPAITSPDGPAAVDLSSDLHEPGSATPIPCPAPVFSDGVLFVPYDAAGSDPAHPWHIAAIDPLTGVDIFNGDSNGIAPTTQLLSGIVPGLPNIVGSLTAAYVTDTVTGAQDKMIYAPTAPQQPAGPTVNSGTIAGVWFSTKGEPMVLQTGSVTRYAATGTRANIPWYLNAPSGAEPDLRPVLHKLTAAGYARLVYGTDFTVTYEGATAVPPAVAPSRTLIVTLIVPLNPGESLFADYTVDWPGAPLPVPAAGTTTPTNVEMSAFAHRTFTIPFDTQQNPATGTPNHMSYILPGGSVAITPQDLLIVNGGDYAGGDQIFAVHEQFAAAQTRANSPASTTVAWSFFPNAPDDDFAIGTGGIKARLINIDQFTPTPAAVPPAGTAVVATDYEALGATAYQNGVAYAVGYAHMAFPSNGAREFDAAIIMAMRANPSTSFVAQQADGTVIQLPTDLLTLKQPDVVNSTLLAPKYIALREGTNFTADRGTSTITIFNFQSAPTGPCFNTALPILIYDGNTAIADATNPIVNPTTGYGVLDNLLWYMVIPINPPAASGITMPLTLYDTMPASGPTIIGNSLYYGTVHGHVMSIDIGSINANGGQVLIYNSDGSPRIHAAPVLKVSPPFGNIVDQAIDTPVINAPMATTNVLTVGTPQGIAAMDNQLTIIADNNRLLEVDRSDNATWSVDATHSLSLIQGAAAGTGQIAASPVSIARPNVAHLASLNTYLIADTGNNRVAICDRGGIITWELHSFNNTLRFERDGDPITLNSPTDVQTYTQSNTTTLTFTSPITGEVFTYSPPAGGFWLAFHYLIADSGNYRDLEVVDIFDMNGNPIVMTGSKGTQAVMTHQLIFATPTLAEQNRGYRYRTVQQFQSFDTVLKQTFTYLISAVDNVRQAALDPNTAIVGTFAGDTQGPGGSLMIMQRYPATGPDGKVATIINSLAIPDASAPNGFRHQAVNNPTFFKEYEVQNPSNLLAPFLHYLLADANGCYSLVPSTVAGKSEATVEWMLTNDDYLRMTGRPLRASSIVRLVTADYDPGTNKFYPHYLITNSYTGDDSVVAAFGNPALSGNVGNPNLAQPLLNAGAGSVHGEVFEVRSDYFVTLQGGYRNPQAWLYTVNTITASYILQLNPLSAISWMVPNETISQNAPLPGTFPPAIKRTIGSGTAGTNAGLLEQPRYAERPF